MRHFLNFVFFSILATSCCHAADTKEQGARIYRIPDGKTNSCINQKTDKVSLVLRRIVIQKDKGLFSSDKEVGLLLETKLGASTVDSNIQRNFPRMFKTSIEEYDKGIVSLPIEELILHEYTLNNSTYVTNNIEMTFTVLKKKKKDNFGIVIEELANITKSLPLPPNPYAQAFQFFADYANNTVTKSINEQNNISEELKGGQITMKFSPDGNCPSDEEMTGTFAVIRQPSKVDEENGFIDTANDYCWKAQFKPTFEIRYAKMPTDMDCENKQLVFKKLLNPYLGFILTAYTLPSKDDFQLFSVMEGKLFKESIERCEIHGIPNEKCF